MIYRLTYLSYSDVKIYEHTGTYTSSSTSTHVSSFKLKNNSDKFLEFKSGICVKGLVVVGFTVTLMNEPIVLIALTHIFICIIFPCLLLIQGTEVGDINVLDAPKSTIINFFEFLSFRAQTRRITIRIYSPHQIK